jgi:MoaD family protein
MTKKITIKLFGICQEIANRNEIEIRDSSINNSDDLLQELKNQFPDFNKISSLSLAVNHVYAQEEVEIKPGDEIALIPPVSGG